MVYLLYIIMYSVSRVWGCLLIPPREAQRPAADTQCHLKIHLRGTVYHDSNNPRLVGRPLEAAGLVSVDNHQLLEITDIRLNMPDPGTWSGNRPIL